MTGLGVGQTLQVPGKVPPPGWGARAGFLEEMMLELRLNKTVICNRCAPTVVHLAFSLLHFACVSSCPDVT